MKKNYFKNLAQVAVLLCAPLFIASCDEFGTEDNPAGAYPSMSTAAVKLNLGAIAPATIPDGEYGSTYTRTANVASPAYVDYSSSDEKVATVDGYGVVTAVGGGTCEISAKPYFFKGGGKLYTKEEIKYPVTVKDWRAKVKFSTTEATVNSADIADKVYKFAKADIVYPAEGTTVIYTHAKPAGSTVADPVGVISADGVITLSAENGVSEITATITPPAGYETTTFGATAKFTLTVKEGIAYISGYDAEAKPIRSTMFLKGADGKDQYKKIDAAWVTKQGANATLDGGIYYVTAAANPTMNIKIKGDATFILADGSKFHFDGTLTDDTPNSHTLNIYGQTAQTGELHPYRTSSADGDRIIDFKEINVYGGYLWAGTNTDGSGAFNKNGAINVFKGGRIFAENYGSYGYGIKMNTGGKVTVDGGTLTVNGTGSNADDSYALIGDVTVKNKGELKASSASYRAVNGTVTATTAKETDATTWTWDSTKKIYDGTWADFTGTPTKKYVWAK